MQVFTRILSQPHLGTTRDLVNNSGSVVNHYTYDSFGNVVAATPGATADTRYKYTGREWDAETGLYYYRARYYDPATGRFIEQDPIGFEAGDANLYRYVGNDSTNLVDPSGLFKIELEYDKIANLGHHARLIFVRENGIRVMYEAGPSEGGSGNASRNTSGSKGSSGFLVPNMDTFGKPDLSPHPLNLTQFIYDSNRDNNCKSELQTEQAIRKMFLALIPARVDYQTLSRNSNSAVFQALENTLPGNQRPVPKSGLWVPAWEINPFTGKRSPKAPPPLSFDLDPHKNLPPNLPSGTWAM